MKHIKKIFALISISLCLSACASYEYTSNVILNERMIQAKGETLKGKKVTIPDEFSGKQTLLLLGYKQDSQFDIDRWLIGLDMTQTSIAVYEIPTIQGMAPRMFSTFINNGMRRGIPKDLWKGVITIYSDGDRIQRYTGNQNPNNTRVILLDEQGKVIYFYDRGFSVDALNNVRKLINR